MGLVLDEARGGFAERHPTGRGNGLHPLGHPNLFTDRGVTQSARTDFTCDNLAGVQAYTSSISNISPKVSLALAQAGMARDFNTLDELMKKYVHPLYAFRERLHDKPGGTRA